VNPERLLRDVPTIDEWAASNFDFSGLDLAEMGRVEEAYWTQFGTRLSALDEDGLPTVPPDEHIEDAFARVWLPGVDESAARRAEFGTVAVVPQRVACDACGWGSARYESRVGPRRDFAALCLCCLVRRGDRILGHGHSVMMLLPEEIPDRVLSKLMAYIPADARASWARSPKADGWDSYRRWGFTGPDERGRLYAVILNVQVSVELGPQDAVELIAQRIGVRHMYTPGGDTHYGPRSLDDLDVRAFLLRVLEREVQVGRARGELERHFTVPAVERDERAMAALQRHGGDQWLRLGEHPIAESADHQMALAAAGESESPSVAAALARSHPDPKIRRVAIANPALEPRELAKLAADRDAAVSQSLLEREDLPAESTAQVVETLLLAGSLDRYAMHTALKRPDFPDGLLETVITRIAGHGTHARIALASEIHEAPTHRRDAIHLQLLRNARKVKSTVDLIDAVIGPHEDRATWLADSQEWKIRALMAWRDEQRVGVEPARAVADEPPAASPVEQPHSTVDLTAPAVSARLRRWWLHEAMADRDLLASDLGDALMNCKLVRLGSDVQVHMPYNFGLGSPIDAKLEQRMTDRVEELTVGAVRRITWLLNELPKPTTRERSSDLDIYEPGDPNWDDWTLLAAQLGREIMRSAAGRALTTLTGLRLAGVSRHRMWLAMRNSVAVRAIGTTPGVAATLKMAVAKVQGRKPEEALYSVVADPSPDIMALF
jgi:hypothetical protein